MCDDCCIIGDVVATKPATEFVPRQDTRWTADWHQWRHSCGQWLCGLSV